jgi:hypothetical protein
MIKRNYENIMCFLQPYWELLSTDPSMFSLAPSLYDLLALLFSLPPIVYHFNHSIAKMQAFLHSHSVQLTWPTFNFRQFQLFDSQGLWQA